MAYHRLSKCLASVALGALALGLPATAQEAEVPQQLPPLDGSAAQSGDNALLSNCGGRGAAIWMVDGAASSDASTSADPLRREVPVGANAEQVVAFAMSAEGQVRIEAEALEGDPMIELFSAAGDMLAENDDTPSTLNSSLQQAVPAGNYCLVLSNIRNEQMDATLQISRPDQPPLLNEESTASMTSSEIAACTTATEAEALADGPLEAVLADGPVTATADGTAPSYFRFQLAEPTALTLRGISEQLDPVIEFFDAATGESLGRNDDSDGVNSRLDYGAPLAAGEYCLGIASYSPAPGEMFVSIEKLDRDSFLRNAYQSGELVPPMDGSYPVEQIDLKTERQTVLMHNGGAHWVSFTLDAPQLVVINAYGSAVEADTTLHLFTAAGQSLGQNDDSDTGGTDSMLTPMLLQPGQYAVAVGDLSRETPANGGAVRPIRVTFDLFARVEPEQAQ